MTILTSVTTPASSEAAMRTLITTALAAGWTVRASSDGTTYNASGNQISSDSGANSLANAAAWVRLRAPTGTRELVFQRGSNSTQWRALYSVSGFSGGSPGATEVPTSADQKLLIGGGTAGSPSYATLFGTDGAYRWLLSFDDAAPYECWGAALTIGSLAATTAIVCLGMEAGSYDSGDADPYALAAQGSSVLVQGQLWQSENTAYVNFHAWYRYGLGGETWAACPFGTVWFGQGNIRTDSAIVGLGLAGSVSGQEFPIDILAGFRHTVTGFKGHVRGAKYVAATTVTAPNGTHLTDGNSRTWVRIGDLWLQWDAVVPSL